MKAGEGARPTINKWQPGRYGFGEAAGDGDHAAFGRVEVVGGDQVEGAPLGGERAGVDLPPIDAVGDAGRCDVLRGPFEAVGGEVGSGDVPALLRQPDDVSALTAADVERGTGGQGRGDTHELRVGSPAPDRSLAGVPLVPARWPEHLAAVVVLVMTHGVTVT